MPKLHSARCLALERSGSARGRRAHLKDSSHMLLNLEGVAGSDGVVDYLEHRSAASEAEEMSE